MIILFVWCMIVKWVILRLSEASVEGKGRGETRGVVPADPWNIPIEHDFEKKKKGKRKCCMMIDIIQYVPHEFI